VAVQPRIRVELLGGFRISTDGRPAARLPTARQQQLIACLILHARGGPIPRQRVGGWLWPESTDAQALTNLRRELHHLRDSWPALDDAIDAASRTIGWRHNSNTTVDILEFESAAARGIGGERSALLDAAASYVGDLLPDCTGEWIEGDRERLRQRFGQVLVKLVGVLEQEGAFGDAIGYAEALLRLDRLDEQAWCTLMRCHARHGERATALHLYQQLTALLKQELGVLPGAAARLTYREILDLDAAAPPTPAPPRSAAYPLVGRQAEWHALLTGWRNAAAGRSGLFAIRGEAGIGKTRLAEELLDWAPMNGITAVTARCYAGEGRLAYAPVAAWLKSEALRPALMQLEPSALTDVARLCPEVLVMRPQVASPDRHLESWQRLAFFEALAQAMRSAAPLVLAIDDLQWADGDTIEWLQYFLHSSSRTRCLVVATIRAEEEQDNPPLVRLLRHLERDGQLTAITLGPLDRTATGQLAGEVAEHPLDESELARTYRDTEGHPLFIVERGRMGLVEQPPGGEARPPERVQAVVAARLALLSDEARAVAEMAAALGRDFRFDILAQASDLEEDALVRALDELWRRQVVRIQSDERWDFSHDRIREVAYAAIGPARRRLIHRRIAQGMELLFADRLDDESASIAVHLDRGGQAARAVIFLERAAAVAGRLSAHEEAIRCLNHALTLLQALPASRQRDERELSLRSSLSIALNSGRGYAAVEVEQNLDRVFALSRVEGRGQVPVRWLWVAFTLRFMLGDLKGTRDVSERALAYSAADPSCRCEAHHAMGGTLMHIGELEASKRHFEAALAAYDERHPQQSALGSDLGVFAHGWHAHGLWLLGDERGSLACADEGIALARRLAEPYSETLALAYAALLHQLRGDVDRVLAHAEPAAASCARYGFAYYGDWAQILIGWAHGQEHPTAGIARIERAFERLDRQRAQARRPYYLSLLAELHARLGDREQSAAILDTAIAMAVERSDVWWLPAMYLQRSQFETAHAREATLRDAVALARAQHSRALEKRILASSTVPSL
jgi:DNA-binding SARP family transcriptional activator